MIQKVCFFVLATLCLSLQAQENLTYQKPPKEILDLVDFERAPSVITDSKKEYIIFSYRDTYKTLADLSQDEMKLAGLRINPVTNISSTATYITNLKIKKFKDQNEVQVKGLPTKPKIANMKFSPDEKMLAFTHTSETGVELWIMELSTGTARKLTEGNLNANLGNPVTWFKNNQSLLVRMLPPNRSALIDGSKSLPVGPAVTVSEGSKAQNRTYQDLLKNKTDELNFENLITSELYLVKLDGSKTLWKEKGMYAGEYFSPDGNFIMVSTIEKPFSYLVQLNRFPSKLNVYDAAGKIVKTVNEVPLTEVLPKGFMAVRSGKRNISWRPDQPATLYYVQALDEGDPEKSVSFRDEIFQWQAPFDGTPKRIAKTIQRFGSIEWGNDEFAILTDDWWNTRNTKTYIFNPSKPEIEPRILFDRSSQDSYSDPGNFEMKRNKYGEYVLGMEGENAILIGDGYTAKGQFPFIDEVNLRTMKKTRIYQSTYTNKLERIFEITDFAKGEVLVMIESKSEYPNYYLRSLKKKNAPLIPLTHFENPFKSIAGIHKEVLKYKRADGVELSATLYLPVGYDKTKKEKLPMIMWAYPQEFKDKNSAGQTTSNPNEFTFPFYGSPIYWVTRGYVVLDDAAFPILGEGEEQPNDSFISQLVANAEAAINAVDALGYIDRSKVAVGGHSYGAFMTANLLTHSNLFACGVARSGAYNRTLTPFGFQSEERNYWEASNVYNTMSPFMTADKMKTPLLLIHGEADNNPGTFTLQSERYFNALKGLGNPARLVLLPKESHGYVAKESILHVLWEQDQWFEKYLKKK